MIIMTIIKTIPIYEFGDILNVYFWIGLACGILALLALVCMTYCARKGYAYAGFILAMAVLFLILTTGFFIMSAIKKSESVAYNEYIVQVDGDINLNEFSKKYKILERIDDNTYKIIERGENNDYC